MKKDIRIVTIDEAKKQLSKLDAPVPKKMQRLAFLSGQISIPDDSDAMGSAEIAKIFEGEG